MTELSVFEIGMRIGAAAFVLAVLLAACVEGARKFRLYLVSLEQKRREEQWVKDFKVRFEARRRRIERGERPQIRGIVER